ncbi:hypothetical protein GCM10023211_02350 [Orbus sasakiae]|uniref:Minor tail T domain-containing protein n=2 Tax=Orbus sasakiae TaxID=1078475 RepID=A0ABP9N2R3_9GAMM
MKLALRLGMTLSQLEHSMTASEFYLWVGFDQINPIGDERNDIHAAQVASAVYQSQGAKVSLQDILLNFGQKSELNKDNSLEKLFEQLSS